MKISNAESRRMFVKARRLHLRAAPAEKQRPRPYQPAEQKYQDEDGQSNIRVHGRAS